MEGYAAAARAVSEQAPRVASEMNPQAVSNTLYAIAKLAEKEVEGGTGGGAGGERAGAARGG